jgi:hypothetical protein
MGDRLGTGEPQETTKSDSYREELVLVRRLVLVLATAAAAVLAVTAVAHAVTNTLSYSAKLGYKGKPTAKKPANLAYTGTLHIDTDPSGHQPDTAPVTSIWFAKAIKNNAKHFPSCTRSAIDGKARFPSKCNKAVVGSGTATALAGVPGSPSWQSVKEDLNVKAVNGPKGKAIYLVLSSEPGAPVALANRVVPGAVVKSSGQFGFQVRFTIPEDLQSQLGLSISLTDFNVKIGNKARTVKLKVKGKKKLQKKKLSYLQLTSCKRQLPSKAVTEFKDTSGGRHQVTSRSQSRC